MEEKRSDGDMGPVAAGASEGRLSSEHIRRQADYQSESWGDRTSRARDKLLAASAGAESSNPKPISLTSSLGTLYHRLSRATEWRRRAYRGWCAVAGTGRAIPYVSTPWSPCSVFRSPQVPGGGGGGG